MASKQGVCHSRVLIDCDHAINTHLNFEKVIPAMVERKVLNKRTGKQIRKKKDTELLIAILKDRPFDDFLTFLGVIQSFGKEDKGTAVLMKIISGSLKHVVSTDQKALDTISSFMQTASQEKAETTQTQSQEESSTTNLAVETNTSLTDINVCPETSITQAPTEQDTTTSPEVQPTIEKSKEEGEFRKSVESESLHMRDSSEAAISSLVSETVPSVRVKTNSTSESFPESLFVQQTLPSTTNLRPHRPPPGFTGECMSRPFTHEGGMLYLSEHGVTVIIPSGAVPVGEKFVMSVHVYLHGPFSLLDDVEPCSAIVWFGVQPPMEFQKDVTVKIPHAAVVEVEQDGSDDLCSANNLGVYRTPKEGSGLKQLGQVYQLTQRIPGDFQDGYHAVFKVRHFSPHVVGKENDSSNKHASRNTGYNSSSSLHVVESRKQLLSNNDMSQRLRSFSSSLESQGSFGDSGASGSSSPIVSALRENPNVQFASSPLSTSISNNVFGESSSAQPSRHTSGGGKRLSTKKKANLKSSKSKRRVGDIKFCIALCMPGDRSMTEWEATFAVCYNHPTGNSVSLAYLISYYVVILVLWCMFNVGSEKVCIKTVWRRV